MSNKAIDNINILYEDNDCLVIDKPAGIMVHSDGRANGPFVTDWVINKYPETLNVGDSMRDQDGNEVNRSGIVHRLDRETSGVLIIAKNSIAHEILKKQFQERTILKKYLAFVWGEIKEDFGTINRPIGRSNKDFRKFSAQRGAKGDMREAETYWTKISTNQVFSVDNQDVNKKDKFSFIEVEPKTGRTHQIRVHFNAINHPVVGDMLYAPKKPFALGFKRLALHSRSIEFDNVLGKRIKVVSPLPNDFVDGLKSLGIESLITV